MSDLPTADRDGAGESYDAMLEMLDFIMDDLREKIEGGRIRDVDTEKVRIKQYRALAYAVRTKRKVLEDKTLEDLAEEVAELREERENDPVLGGGR